MSISKAEHDELCCVYAGLLLFDEGIEITAEKINKIILIIFLWKDLERLVN